MAGEELLAAARRRMNYPQPGGQYSWNAAPQPGTVAGPGGGGRMTSGGMTSSLMGASGQPRGSYNGNVQAGAMNRFGNNSMGTDEQWGQSGRTAGNTNYAQSGMFGLGNFSGRAQQTNYNDSLGQVSELMRLARSDPGMADYLRSQGLMPNISTMGPSQYTQQGGGNQTDWNLALRNQQQAQARAGHPGQSGAQYSASRNNGPTHARPDGSLYTAAPGSFNRPLSQFGINSMPGSYTGGQYNQNEGNSTWTGSAGFGGGSGGGGLDNNLEAAINKLLGGYSGISSGQETAMRTRASDTVAGNQAAAEQRAREDAVRRGASTQAGGDSDIRTELNRVGAEGARTQVEAGQDIDQMLAQLKNQNLLAGVQSGSGYVQKMAELQALLAALQQQQGSGGSMGLQLALGGR